MTAETPNEIIQQTPQENYEGFVEFSSGGKVWEYAVQDTQDIFEKHYPNIDTTIGKDVMQFAYDHGADIHELDRYAMIAWKFVILYNDNGMRKEMIIQFDDGTISMYKRNLTSLRLEEKGILEQNIESLSIEQRKLEFVLQAIEGIFKNNDREFFWAINERDIFPVGQYVTAFPWNEIPEVIWKQTLTIQELQDIAKNLLKEIKSSQSDIGRKYIKSISDAINISEEKYIDYIVGIWDRYEGWARALYDNVDEKNISNSVRNLVSHKDIWELFSYMIQKHALIEENNFQSTEAWRTYILWNQEVNKAALKKIKSLPESNEQEKRQKEKRVYQYMKIVTGRDVPELHNMTKFVEGKQGPRSVSVPHSLDTHLIDIWSASEAFLYVFEKPGGIRDNLGMPVTIKDKEVERYKKSVAVEDPEGSMTIKDKEIERSKKTPTAIIADSIRLVDEKVEWFDTPEQAKGLISAAGFSNIVDIAPGITYADMSLEEKMQISVLMQLIKKLRAIKPVYARSRKTGPRGRMIHPATVSIDKFGPLFLDAAEDGQQAVIEGINDNFNGELSNEWSKDSSDFNLSKEQWEILDLHNDIWGNGGLLDFSDQSLIYAQMAGQFGAVLAGSIGIAMAAAATFPIAATTAWFFAVAAVSSVWISSIVVPEWYDSIQDMSVDKASDLITALIFSLVWGLWTHSTKWALQTVQASGGGWGSAEGARHIFATAMDLWILGIGTELFRGWLIRDPDMMDELLNAREYTIEEKNRFLREDFHNYVKLNLEDYMRMEQWLDNKQ